MSINGITQTESLPFLKVKTIHSKPKKEQIMKPQKYILFQQQQQFQDNQQRHRSPIKLNPVFQYTFSQSKVLEIKSYSNQLYEQYKAIKNEQRMKYEKEIQKQKRIAQYQAEKAKIQYLQEDDI